MTDTSLEVESPKTKIPLATILSGVFLLVVLALTGLFYYQSTSLDAQIEVEKKRSQEYQDSIVALKSDPAVQASEVLKQAKPEIIKSITNSVASNYIRELDRIHRDYLIQFSGFAYQPGHITTSVTAEKGLSDDAIRKVIKLIGDYRTNTYSGSLMLSPVTSVSGDADKRSFGVDFKIK